MNEERDAEETVVNAELEKKLKALEKAQKREQDRLGDRKADAEMQDAKLKVLEEIGKFATEAFHACARRGTNYPYHESEPLFNIPQEWKGPHPWNVTESQKAGMAKVGVAHTQEFASKFKLQTLHRASRQARKLAKFWKTHSSAGYIAEALLNTYGYTYTGTFQHTMMNVPLSILMAQKAIDEETENGSEQPHEGQSAPDKLLMILRKKQNDNEAGSRKAKNALDKPTAQAKGRPKAKAGMENKKPNESVLGKLMATVPENGDEGDDEEEEDPNGSQVF